MALDDHDERAVLSRRVQLAVAELNGISVLPSVAAQVLACLSRSSFSGEDVAAVVEVSPALTWLTFTVAHDTGIYPAQLDYRMTTLLRRIPRRALYHVLLSLQSFPEPVSQPQESEVLTLGRANLVQHSLAVALGARRLAQSLDDPISENLAYAAGLLHDVGKLALQQTLPQGYSRLVSMAQKNRSGLCESERSQLGIDHAAVGAYLARRWHLPGPLERAIWLHHGAGSGVAASYPDLQLAQVVQVADAVVRSLALGHSGSFAPCPDLADLAALLEVDQAILETVQEELPEMLEQAAGPLGLLMEDADRQVSDNLRNLVIHLGNAQDTLSDENRQLKSEAAQLDFMQRLVAACDSHMNAMDVAAVCALQWQRYFQTGSVCLFLYPTPDAPLREVVWVDALAQVSHMVLAKNLDDVIECAPFGVDTPLTNAYDWEPLFEEIEADFNIERTRAVVCMSGSHPAAALAFELGTPDQDNALAVSVPQVAPVVGTLLALSQTSEAALEIIEMLRATTASSVPVSSAVIQTAPSLDAFVALTEMAAGMAHELNNPLSVISGRAQLLAETITDSKARQDLQQIQENAREVAQLVESLMGFADPAPPQPTRGPITEIITDAVDLARVKVGQPQAAIQVFCPEPTPEVWVDSAMIASALANVISNALESYEGMAGSVEVGVEVATDHLRVCVTDRGCGMDADTLRKAVQPFYSAKPAGRKRGMGLAYAQRLLQINKGEFAIQSELGQGTTAILTLPIPF